MFDRILCAHDLSDHGKPVLRAALDLGRQLKAVVHVVHVVTPPLALPPGIWFEVPAPDMTSFEGKIRHAVTEELERAIREARCEGDPQTRVHVHLGEEGASILACADNVDAGLIVMGTHGRKGWKHLMLGSVAERVIRTAKVPVLTVAPAAVQAVEGSKAAFTEA